jgi:hypothetical protein
MLFEEENLSGLVFFAFVSGHDFSRAVTIEYTSGFSPCQGKTCTKCQFGRPQQ